MNSTLSKETTTQTNDLGYPALDADSFKPLGDMILVQWEPAQDEIKIGQTTLIRPDTYKKIHYTGIILSRGPGVDSYDELSPGIRIIFDRFSNFDKYFDPKYGRLALISESQQGSCFAVIPPRTIISSLEGDENDA